MWLLIVSSLAVIGLTIFLLERWYRRPYIDGYQSKAVFITGTDSGFGFELAVNLAKHGVKVYAGCYTEEGAENLLKATNDGVVTLKIDITDEESVLRAKDIIEQDLKKDGKELWGLVNNAGMLCGYNFALATREDYRRLMEVNFFGAITVTETFLPLIKRSAGRIVNMISMMGRISASAEPYSCSKHAMEPYSDGLRLWMKRYKVHVAIIEPGVFVFTGLQSTLEDTLNKEIARLPTDLQEEYGETFLSRMKQEVMDLVRYPAITRFNKRSMITNAIKHGLFAKRPKARYVVGWDANIMYRHVHLLPDYIQDFIFYRVCKYYGIETAKDVSARI